MTLWIDTSGNVGIGTTGPESTLDIQRVSGNTGGTIRLSRSTTSDVGLWYSTGAVSSSCDTECTSDDGAAGFNSVSGICLAAWNSTAGTSTCATSGTDQACLCAGSGDS